MDVFGILNGDQLFLFLTGIHLSDSVVDDALFPPCSCDPSWGSSVVVVVEVEGVASVLASSSLLRLLDFLDSIVSISSSKVTSLLTINSSSPKGAAAALPA